MIHCVVEIREDAYTLIPINNGYLPLKPYYRRCVGTLLGRNIRYVERGHLRRKHYRERAKAVSTTHRTTTPLRRLTSEAS
jgi:hypothetical protein